MNDGPAVMAGLIAKQVGNLAKEGSIGTHQVGGKKPRIAMVQRVVVGIEDQVALLVAVVVANEEHRPGIDPVGEQHVRPQFPAERVVFHDVAQEKPIGELVSRLRPVDLHIEHFAITERIDKITGSNINLRLHPFEWANRHEDATSRASPQERAGAVTHLVAVGKIPAESSFLKCAGVTSE